MLSQRDLTAFAKELTIFHKIKKKRYGSPPTSSKLLTPCETPDTGVEKKAFPVPIYTDFFLHYKDIFCNFALELSDVIYIIFHNTHN